MPSSTNTLNPTGATPTDPYTLSNDLASTDPDLGASLIGVAPNGCFTSTNVQDALEEICAGGGGGGPTTADQVSIIDAGGYYTSDNVEGALQEVGSELQDLNNAFTNLTAADVGVVDAGGYYTSDDAEGVLQEVGLSIQNINAALGDITASEVSIADAGGYYTSTDVEGALQELGAAQGAPNGIATLDAFGKVPTSQLSIPDPIYFEGTWDALNNIPDISVAPNEGATWIVNQAGTTNLGGITDWQVGDWAIYHDGDWFKIDNTASAPVISVNGYIGAVVLTKTDVGLGNVENTALSTWGGSTNLVTLGTVTTGTWQGSPVGVMYGGTGATNASDARDNLDLTIGSDVQAWSAALDALAAGTYTGATSITTLGTITTGSIPASLVTVVDVGGYFLSTDVEGVLQELGASTASLATWPGSVNIITLGTITTGVWNATAVAPAYGGTGITSYTLGDTLYASGPSTLSKLAGNTTTTRQFLRQTGTGLVSAPPVWDTVTKTDVGLENVENTALSTWAGSTNLTTLGTITTGVWNGTAVPILYGGTGQTTKTAAFDALSPMTTLGDIIYGGVAGTATRLAGNSTTTRQFLREVGTGAAATAPVWDTVTKTDVGLGNVENTALSTWAGSANITTLGTIASGTVPAALTSIVDVGNYYTGTNVEAALQEVGLSLSTGAGGVRFNVASGTFQEATLGNYLFDVRYVNTGTGATPGANISSLAKGNGNNSTGLQVTADVTASGQTAKAINVTAGSANSGTLVFGVDIGASSSGNTGTATGLRSVVTGTSSTNVGIATSVTVNTAATTNTGVSVSVSGVSTNVGESISVTGAALTNTGLTVSASGATTNYSALFTAGNVGVGTSTPGQLLTVQNGNLLLTNNNNTAAELRLGEPSTGGANYTAFKATTQAADITYTLPAALPAAQASGTSFGNAFLETLNTGVQTWRQQSLSVTASLNFNNTAAQSSSDLTIAVTGAAVGDCVSLGVDQAAVLANSCYTAWVSAADTVTVRFNNYSAATQNPAAGTFKVIVTK